MTKHTLRYNGTAFTEDGQLVNPDTTVTSGAGRAMCGGCGELSPELPTGKARREWFKAHRAEAPALATTLAAETEPEITAPVPAEDTPAEPEAPTKKAAGKVATKRVEFAPYAPVSYWRFLGRDGSVSFLGQTHPDVKVTPDNGARLVRLEGPAAEVGAAAVALRKMWQEAVKAAAEWERTDTTYLNRPRGGLEGRRANYFLKGEFFATYADHAAQQHEA